MLFFALAGVVSLVPGGLGSFDLVFLTGLGQYGIDTGVLLPAMLLYRLVYYILPFCLGLIFAAFEMTGVAIKKFEDKPFIAPALETTGVIWTLQRDFLGKLGSWASLCFNSICWLNGYFINHSTDKYKSGTRLTYSSSKTSYSIFF